MEALCRLLGVELDIHPLQAAVLGISEDDWAADDYRQHGTRVAAKTQAIRLTRHWDRFGALVEPLLCQVEALYPSSRRGKLVLSRIPPGAMIQLHRDAEPDQATLHRVHVPLLTNPRAFLYYPQQSSDPLHLEEGKAYEIATEEPHKVKNLGKTARVHLVMDVHF